MSTSPEAKQAAEWTPRKVMELLGVDYQPPLPALQKVAQEHNAATAKLREEFQGREDSIRRAVVLAGEEAVRQDQVIAGLRKQLAHQYSLCSDSASQQPSAPTEYGPKLPWPRGGYGATTPDVEKIVQEIKDLFAIYGSRNYSPSFNEVAIIDEALPRLIAQAHAPLVAALKQARKIIANSDRPLHIEVTKAIDAALTGTGEK